MSDFKWNEEKEHFGKFWDEDVIHDNHTLYQSDKQLINHPGGVEIRLAVEALCRAVSELVEIEENRNKHD